MDIHPPKHGINMYWSIAMSEICIHGMGHSAQVGGPVGVSTVYVFFFPSLPVKVIQIETSIAVVFSGI